MKSFQSVLVAGALLAASSSVAAAEPAAPPEPDATREACAVLFGVEGSLELPDMHVVDLKDGEPFALPAAAPANVTTVLCKRDLIVPSHNDFRVLLAGYVLIIASDDRVGALERANGVFRFRMMKGELTPAEQAQVNAFLADAKRKVDAEKAAAAK